MLLLFIHSFNFFLFFFHQFLSAEISGLEQKSRCHSLPLKVFRNNNSTDRDPLHSRHFVSATSFPPQLLLFTFSLSISISFSLSLSFFQLFPLSFSFSFSFSFVKQSFFFKFSLIYAKFSLLFLLSSIVQCRLLMLQPLLLIIFSYSLSSSSPLFSASLH